MIGSIIIFFLADVLLTFFLVRTYLKLLETRCERDEAREQRRHAEHELRETELILQRIRASRVDSFLEASREQQTSSAYRMRWN